MTIHVVVQDVSSSAALASVAGTTLAELIRAIGEELGRFESFTSTSTSSSTSQVVSTQTADSEAVTSKYGGHYLYAPSGALAGEQRRIQKRGFTGSTGTYATVGGFSAIPQNGQAWYRLGSMPAVQADGLLGIREAVNRMLRKLWVVDRYPFTATASDIEVELGSLWWATRKRFRRLIAPAGSSLAHPYSGDQPWSIRQDGELWYLELSDGFTTGETYWLEMEMPANARLYSGGAWGYTSSPSAGLVNPTDRCLGEWNALFQCGLLEAMEALAVQAGGARKAYWRHELDKPGGQRDTVAALKMYDLDGVETVLGEGQTDAAGTNGIASYGPKTWRGFVGAG